VVLAVVVELEQGGGGAGLQSVALEQGQVGVAQVADFFQHAAEVLGVELRPPLGQVGNIHRQHGVAAGQGNDFVLVVVDKGLEGPLQLVQLGAWGGVAVSEGIAQGDNPSAVGRGCVSQPEGEDH